MYSYFGKNRISDAHNSVTFDLKEFSSFQKQIAIKYEPEEDFICKEKGSRDFIHRFDRYILHCLEEIVEAREEIRKSPVSMETIKELIDILMYLGTMNSIIKINLDYFQMKTQDIIELDVYRITRTPAQIDVELMNISELLVEQRRLFPQRKWHKPSSEFPELQLKYVMNELYRMNVEAMTITLELLIQAGKHNHTKINDELNYKQTYVLGLPIPELK